MLSVNMESDGGLQDMINRLRIAHFPVNSDRKHQNDGQGQNAGDTKNPAHRLFDTGQKYNGEQQ
jgi:hypothetical protein